MIEGKQRHIAVVGLGYVGLPLAVAFAQAKMEVLGFDVNLRKIEELKNHKDSMGEITTEELKNVKIQYSSDSAILKQSDFIVVAIPTPVNESNVPDLTLLEKVSQTIGENLQPGTIIVFESTVYPGVTEEVCVPIMERYSGLRCGTEWKVGYSPERINPGDKKHSLEKIIKIVSGMDEETLGVIDEVYGIICKAGVYKAPNIKTAEAAKVIENIQRDLNIALVNELALIFHRIGINTQEVLKAAGTKWNFHKYQPGLVGGHCIGVDPYYLTYKAEELGYHSKVILAGRNINDSMGEYVGHLMIKGLAEAGKTILNSKVLVMGLTFKENVRDMRNSKVTDVIQCLKEYKINVFAWDPLLSPEEIQKGFHVTSVEKPTAHDFDGVILVAPHREFLKFSLTEIKEWMTAPGVFVDIKSLYYPAFKEDHSSLIYKCL